MICQQNKLYAGVTPFFGYGIIPGKKIQLRETPYGMITKDLKEGEIVFINKKKVENHYDINWCNISTLNGKTGWVKEESIYYLNENKIPDKYYIQALGRLDNINYSQGGYSLYNVKFGYNKDYNVIVYRFNEKDPDVSRESMEIYEIKNEKAINAAGGHDYGSRVYIDDKYLFVIGSGDGEVYDRLRIDESGGYKRLSRISLIDDERIIKSLLTLNRWNNCYYLKIDVRNYKTGKDRKAVYRFNGEKMIFIDSWHEPLLNFFIFGRE
jgi:hypothetical protein